MPQHTPLIATIVGGIVLAFLFGAIAQRLRISPLVGYLAAGVMAGPFTPGFVAGQSLASELAELGVILVMFGVVARAKTLNPAIRIIARAHSDAEVEHLRRYGADHVIMGEREIALGMIELIGAGRSAPGEPTAASGRVAAPVLA